MLLIPIQTNRAPPSAQNPLGPFFNTVFLILFIAICITLFAPRLALAETPGTSVRSNLTCPLPQALARLGTSPKFAEILELTACIQSAPDSLKSWLDSLRVQLPLAPGYWQNQIIAWSETKNAARLTDIQSAYALTWLLQSLPDLKKNSWRDVSENRAQLGDTLQAGILLLRAVAADSLQTGYAQFRFKTWLRVAAPSDEPPSASQIRIRNQTLNRTLNLWLQPGNWQTPATWQVLEQVLWAVDLSEFALIALQRRLQKTHQLKSLGPWLEAARHLQVTGHLSAAFTALNQADPRVGNTPTLQKITALQLALEAGLSTEQYSLAAQWAESASTWAPQLLESQNQDGSPVVSSSLRHAAIAACLQDGRLEAASLWMKPAWPKSDWDRRDLMQARLFLGQGKPAMAEKILTQLKTSPQRLIGNGTLLQAQGFVAAWQAKTIAADSLWTQASAYVELAETQITLEWRRLLNLDTGVVLSKIIQAQPESPKSVSEKMALLETIPRSSPLWVEAQWQSARYLQGQGKVKQAQQRYEALAKEGNHPRQTEAKAQLAFLLETTDMPQAIANFESLLVESQQGVSAEFARERLRQIAP
jgi:hypothetical protein